MRIPILDLRAQYRALAPAVRAAVERVLESQQFILGEEVARFEEQCAAYLGVRHAIGVASGSDALVLALMALGIGPGDGVATTAMSYVATAEAIVRVGARPVFVDVNPADLNLSTEALEDAVRRDRAIRAVLPVHLYGRSCDLPAILDIARRYDLRVIEDAAQAFGAALGGSKAGTCGDVGCFSFFPSKNLGGAGDGGLVVTDRDDLAAQLRKLRVHGSGASKYLHETPGLNSRLDALQAAILAVKLPHLDAWNEARRERARQYARALEGAPLRLPAYDGAGRHDIFHCHVIRAARRDDLARHLATRGIQTAVHYGVPLHLQPCFAGLGHRPGDLPECERAADEVLSLPIYPELGADALAEVAREVRSFAEDPQ